MNPRFPELQQQLNQDLIAFLHTELDLGFTFARTAEIEAGMNNTEHSERARKHSESAVETIHRFAPKITDPAPRNEILKAADELQQRIASLGAGAAPQE